MTTSTINTADQRLADRARCPRCGYDLRGAIGTWADQCPLQGTCAECGLQFAWVEVLHPEKFEPRWCIEFALGRLGVLTGAIKTLLRSLWPWRFFSSLKMSHTVRPRRLALYLVFLLLIPGILYVAEQTTVAVRVRYFLAGRTSYITAVNHSYFAAILEAVFKPTSSRSGGSIMTTRGWGRYPAPNRLHEVFEIQHGGISGTTAFMELIRPVLFVWTLATILYILLPAAFILLPVSRRRAKVRWAHVARVTAYSFLWPSLFVSAVCACGMVSYLFDDWRDSAPFTALWINLYLPLPLLIVWWAVAVKRYLRMPHAWPVSILLALIALLILVVMMVLLTRLMR